MSWRSPLALAATLWCVPSVGVSQEATELFRFQDADIRESSGVAVSAVRDDIVFTHNDSGDRPRFFAVDGRGCTVARYTLENAQALDWEDMAGGAKRRPPTLWFADIGDNAAVRPGVTVYRVGEPRLPAKGREGRPSADPCVVPAERQVSATRFDFRYADGAHDAETLLVHPRTGRLFVVTKDISGAPAALYSAPRRLRADAVNVLERAVEVALPVEPTPGLAGPGVVTAGDVAPDGKRLVLRSYTDAFEWRIRNGDLAAALAAAPVRIPVPPAPQAEAIAYTASGDAVITTSEDPGMTAPPVYRVAVRD